jgi:hypothetical protein
MPALREKGHLAQTVQRLCLERKGRGRPMARLRHFHRVIAADSHVMEPLDL